MGYGWAPFSTVVEAALVGLEGDGCGDSAVNGESEDVVAAVVASNVERAVRGRDATRLDLGEQQSVLLAERAGHELASGSGDDRVTGVQPLIWVREQLLMARELSGNVRTAQRAAGADHPTAPPLSGSPPDRAAPEVRSDRSADENQAPPATDSLFAPTWDLGPTFEMLLVLRKREPENYGPAVSVGRAIPDRAR
jgi:hypothetical protein